MPIYVYRCQDCETEFEIIHQRIPKDSALFMCPDCLSSETFRIMGKSNFKLKGKGWYSDGYSSQPKKDAQVLKHGIYYNGRVDLDKYCVYFSWVCIHPRDTQRY